MNRLLLLLLLVALCGTSFAQNKLTDSLTYLLAVTRQDTGRVLLMAQLATSYRRTKLDSSVKYARQALLLAQKIAFHRGEALALSVIGGGFRESGDLPKALDYALKALKIAESHQYTDAIANAYGLVAVIYFDLKEYPKSIQYYKQALVIQQKNRDKRGIISQHSSIGASYLRNNQLDSGSYYIQLAYREVIQTKSFERLSTIFRNFGWIQRKLGNNQLALNYLKQGVNAAFQLNEHREVAFNYNEIANLFQEMNQPDSVIFYAKKSLSNAQSGPYNLRILESSTLLAAAYKAKNDFRQAYDYQALMVRTKEGLYGAGNIQAMQTMIADDETRRKEVDLERIANENKLKQYGLLAGLAMLLFIAFVLYRNNLKEKQAKKLLQEKNSLIEQTLANLKATQTQLIQREKMASLGELTAGIAHEIQNPLNFVNNFSEVSVELVEEQVEALAKGDMQEAQAIAVNLVENLQRITQNGQRASNIVKGMLEHSRSSTGERLPTDLNALCDEYFRLSYQGLRAKNKDFNYQLETHFDPTLPLVEVVASDISRVLLNLFNNAFYAVNQKQKTAQADYQPTVAVSTTFSNGQVEIRVKDNGMGIAEAIKEKIFQPFFTTKPTGEGTGLGLSLSYDIVTKGHGGELKVERVEGAFTEFVITLPFTQRS